MDVLKVIPTLEARELIDKIQIDAAALSVAHTNWNLRYVMTTTDEQKQESYEMLKEAVEKAQKHLDKLAKLIEKPYKEWEGGVNG